MMNHEHLFIFKELLSRVSWADLARFHSLDQLRRCLQFIWKYWRLLHLAKMLLLTRFLAH